MDNAKFIKIVKSEMAEIGESYAIKDVGNQFAIWFLSKVLCEEIGMSVEQYHIGGSGDQKIDIGMIDEDHSAVIIGQCKYSENPENAKFNEDLPEEVFNALDRLQNFPEEGHEKRKDFASAFSSSEKPTRLLAIGFGSFTDGAVRYALKKQIEIYDLEKIRVRWLYNEVLEDIKTPDLIKMSYKKDNCIINDVHGSNNKQWIYLAKITDIYSAVDKYKDGIFEGNLRYRLEKSAKSGIGSDIRKTIVDGDSSAFSVLNNGLTIVSSNVVDTDENNLEIINPQIVNGCQTSWAIYDAITDLLKSGETIEDIKTKVLVKLIKTQDYEFAKKITKSTNKQNPIDVRDTYSDDQKQLNLAYAFKNYAPKIFYDHKEGLWEVVCRKKQQSIYKILGTRKYRRISNFDAGQLYLALIGRPYYAKQSKQKIFDDPEYYRVIFSYDTENSKRFDCKTLDLVPSEVESLKPGSTEFVRDIIFAQSIYNLADSVKHFYNFKMNSFPEGKNKYQEVAYQKLLKQKYLTSWHYLLIAIVHHICHSWTKRGVDIYDVRCALVGSEVNLLLGGNLNASFNASESFEDTSIFDPKNPSDNFNFFIVWVKNIMKKLNPLVEAKFEEPGFSFRSFIDQRSDTFSDLKESIIDEYVEGEENWKTLFPIE